MAREVRSIDELSRYLKGVMRRADGHAENVVDVITTIAGCVLWKQDAEYLYVYERNNRTANTAWFYVGGQEYTLSYDPSTGSINLKRGSIQGEVIETFTNQTSPEEVRNIFGGL